MGSEMCIRDSADTALDLTDDVTSMLDVAAANGTESN